MHVAWMRFFDATKYQLQAAADVPPMQVARTSILLLASE
jgi:hypothetical protein